MYCSLSPQAIIYSDRLGRCADGLVNSSAMACSNCQDTLEEDTTDSIGMQKTSMECGCVFHNHCMALYVAAQGGDEVAMPTVPCPNCRQTAVDIREKGIPMGKVDLIDG